MLALQIKTSLQVLTLQRETDKVCFLLLEYIEPMCIEAHLEAHV